MQLDLARQQALEIIARIAPANRPVYLVGGFVRDALLSRESADIDLGIAGPPELALDLARKLANAARDKISGYRASPFALDRDFGVARVIFTPLAENFSEKLFYLDIAVLNGGTIESDLARRDFTINALAFPLDQFLQSKDLRLEEALEVPQGKQDLARHIIRPVGSQNLIDDSLRMLRGIRQFAQLSGDGAEWRFADGTLELFQSLSGLIRQAAAERIRDELNKTWLAGNLGRSLQILNKCNLLQELIPELTGKFEVTSDLFGWLEGLLDPAFVWPAAANFARPETLIREWPLVMAHLRANEDERKLLLFWAALLWQIEPETARSVTHRLRLSRFFSDNLVKMLQMQAELSKLTEKFEAADVSSLRKRAAFRFLRDSQPVQIETLLLALAASGAGKQNSVEWQTQLTLTDLLVHKFLIEKLTEQPRLLDGQQLQKALKIPPGPKIGQLLRELEEAQAEGQITNFEEAVELARQLVQTF